MFEEFEGLLKHDRRPQCYCGVNGQQALFPQHPPTLGQGPGIILGLLICFMLHLSSAEGWSFEHGRPSGIGAYHGYKH